MGFFRIWDIWVKYEQDSGSLKINGTWDIKIR